MRQIAGLLVCCCAAIASAQDSLRTWTEADGRTFQAQFIRDVEGDVTFLTKDGKLLHRHLDKLSEDDQKLIHELEQTKKLDKTIPPAGAPREELPDSTPPADDAQPRNDLRTKLAPPTKRTRPEVRDWRLTDGRKFTKASLARFQRDDQTVILRRQVGAGVPPIPFDLFSREDQQYIRDLLTAWGEGAGLPGIDQPATVEGGEAFKVPESPFVPMPVEQGPRFAGRTPLFQGRGAGGATAPDGTVPEGEPTTETPTVTEEVSLPVAAEANAPAVDVAAPAPNHLDRLHEAMGERFARIQAIAQRLTAGAIVILVAGLVIGLLIASVVGAIILRAAIGIYNSLAGGSRSRSAVPEPTFSEGMGIIFMTWLANMLAGIVLGLVISVGGALAGADEKQIIVTSQSTSFVLSFLVMSSMISSLLPTTFWRSIAVTILFFVILVVLIFLIVFGFGIFIMKPTGG